MDERQILLIKKSWRHVLLNEDEAGTLFYDRLFQIAPEVKYLFKGSVKELTRKLVSMVTFIVSKLHNREDVMHEIRSLAKRNNHYQLSAEYYAFVGEALLWTLENGLAEKWTDELKDTWANVYFTLADSMINVSKNLEKLPQR